MSVDRDIWKRSITDKFVNSYPCPKCTKGKVRKDISPVVLVETEYSKHQHSQLEWDPDWIVQVFTAVLVCDDPSCGECVAVSGDAFVDMEEDYNNDGELIGDYMTFLKPKSMFPAPPLFPLSKKFPHKVEAELRLAFQLYWADLSASTSRLRTSLEYVLDDQGISRFGDNPDGKKPRLSLFKRIELFEQQSIDTDIASSMNALRNVGNLGTHGDEVVKGDYFDLLDVYEDALVEIYEKRRAKLREKAQKLKDL